MSYKIYCYLRVSTEKQDLEGNKGEILLKVNQLQLNSQNIVWIEETISGMKNWKTRELGKIEFKKGDIFITSELSRVGRTMIQIMGFISAMMEKEVKLYFTKSKFEIDNSINSQVLVFAYSLCSQIERELISTRTKDALNNKKKNGDILGRPKNKMILDNKADEIKKALDDGVKIKSIAKKYNASTTTISKLIKKYGFKNNIKII
jgi:putative DNA-invertase from lambdoid prophage Rac